MSSSSIDSVVDTVALRYFLFVDRADLLITLLGRPIGVPRTVFDPDEGDDVPEGVMSEVRRSITVQNRRAQDPTRTDEARAIAHQNAARLQSVTHLHASGFIVTLDMTANERQVFSRLTSESEAPSAGLHIALGSGEAACVAIAVHRGHVLVTDDDDALTALDTLTTGARRARIRALLQEAAARMLMTEEEANSTHSDMRRLGFWDKEPPFPRIGEGR